MHTVECKYVDAYYEQSDVLCLQGPSFFLEDGQSALSINEAVMWAKVNAFSPLASGMRLCPF